MAQGPLVFFGSSHRRTRADRIDKPADFSFGREANPASGFLEGVEAVVVVLAADPPLAKRQKHAEMRLHRATDGNTAQWYRERARPDHLQRNAVAVFQGIDDLVPFGDEHSLALLPPLL